MTRPTLAYLQARVNELQAQIAELSDTELWGNDNDYPVETILMWRRVYGPNSSRRHEYTFTAIKAARNKWRVRDSYLTWDQLVSEYFPDAEGKAVWQAVKFDRI